MEGYKHYLSHINDSIRASWNHNAFRDFQSDVRYTFSDTARKIVELGLLYDSLGVERGAKIAVCGSNCSNIAVSILSVLCNGRVAVMILPDFTGDDIVKLVNHSDAVLMIAGESVLRKIDCSKLEAVNVVINAKTFSMHHAREKRYEETFDNLGNLFAEKYPNGVTIDNYEFPLTDMDDLAVINYTSGTTSAPKGVMISNRALSSNVQYDIENMECHAGITLVSMLPMAHMFGFTIEFLYNFSAGGEICFITRLTTSTLLAAFKECKPILILTVPLVLEKIYTKNIKPAITKKSVRVLWKTPLIGRLIKKRVRKGLMEAFGGNLNTLIIGGAALLPEVEKCLVDIKFPYVIGYGMTECAPLVSYVEWRQYVPGSCGRPVDRVQVRVDSKDGFDKVGELLIKGDNVMMGYYKNEEATKAIFTEDGWLRSGDLGILDKHGNVFLKGRCKSMILGSSGQNIYPEEIESLLDAEPEVCENVIVKRDDKIVALVYAGKGIDVEQARPMVEEAVKRVNAKLPSYSKIGAIEMMKEEFEKTPKCSIKRHLYQ